jgi:hypothetical protein
MLNAKASTKVQRMLISVFAVQNGLKQDNASWLLPRPLFQKVLESQDGL